MAKQKTTTAEAPDEDFAQDLISSLNKEFGSRVAFNLGTDESPNMVKRWISTGSTLLDYAIRNAAGGGYPEGRIIEISGDPSVGKSHAAFFAAANVQRMGGLVVYIDTESAVPVEKLAQVGIDVRKRFVYATSSCTEEVFSIIESTILKAKQVASKGIPILVVLDSIAACSPKAELEGDYDQNTVGLQARVVSKAMRKITNVIANNNVTLLILNQLRTAIGVMHGDPNTTPGGKSIPFHSSVRVRLSSGKQVQAKDGTPIGSHVICTIKKNKVGPPWRKVEFDIIFGKGIVEDDYLFDVVRAWSDKNKGFLSGNNRITLTGPGAWKDFTVADEKTGEVVAAKKFYKSDFASVRNDPQFKPHMDKLIDAALTVLFDSSAPAESSDEHDDESDEDVDE